MFKYIALLITFFSFAQNQQYHIVYDYTLNSKDIGLITNLKSYLTGDGKTSIYEEDFMKSKSQTAADNSFSIPTKNNPAFFKEIHSKIVTYNDHIQMKFFDVKDNLPSFDWEITSETKNILGYTCQKAILRFRGRDYTVYFTTDIPYSDGPWKFSGLPGMILEATSDDEAAAYSMIAEKVELKETTNSIQNPYLKSNSITYQNYLDKYKVKYDESRSRMDTNGYSRGMNKGAKEVYITY
ncbi:GLPGLI family protein [Flavobacterium sp. CG_9.1]|uniref:GLPGLI family protein n=1 Tax=Flavobacterium sp. CG_9.1 TaxID=2787728 RepID=UPI0018C8DCB5|nr:GLPGLI family protein [Flavobacterium sp. CG_9.1]MBG6063489.1 GLPGLI family protein [Flavobacterium sp. CG_9.1]